MICTTIAASIDSVRKVLRIIWGKKRAVVALKERKR